MPDAPDVMMCRNELRLGLFAAVDALSAEERAGRSPRAVTDWALDEAPEGLAETRGALSAEQQRDLEPYLTIIEAYQELARRLFYIGRPYSTDRTLPWETRLLWDFISASARDTYETTRSVALLSALGMDAPAKTLLRHQMELYGRLLVVLRDPEQQRAYLAALQRLRDMQMAETDTAEDDLRTIALVGGPLMDRLASIEQNLDEANLPSRAKAEQTASMLRDVYTYFSSLTHGAPAMVDDVLFVYDPTFPSKQRRRASGYGKPTNDGRLSLAYLPMLLWMFWRMVPRALERSGLADPAVGDAGILLVASRGLERAVVECFGSELFSDSEG